MLKAALREIMGHATVAGGWREMEIYFQLMYESLNKLQRTLEKASTAARSKAELAQKKKEAKAAARRMVDDAAALAIMAEERARQVHGYLKRAAKRTGLSAGQLERLRTKRIAS